LLRVLLALLMAMSLSGLSHAAEEVAESAVHLADTGHSAHAELHPEGEATQDTEHFCFGAVHHCGCCSTAVAAPIGSSQILVGAARKLRGPPTADDYIADGVPRRIDRPPRA
jgi:hypothetical protein